MTVTVSREGEVAVVTIDNPPVNAASHAVRSGLVAAVCEVDADVEVTSVVLICAGKTFVAGADVREFDRTPQEPLLPDVVAAIEGADKPWIAAIHGTALGGGLEIALGCAFRIAASDARLGLPEVNLGLIPGAGGTVRLPRLIDPTEALTMVAGGRPVSARQALETGLVDALSDGDHLADSIAFARQVKGRDRPAALGRRAASAPADPTGWDAVVAKLGKSARGQNAIPAAIAQMELSLSASPETALAAERDAFLTLKSDPQSAALRYITFAERSVARIPRLKDVATRPVDAVGVVGGGTMGAGIVSACLLSGLTRVVMIERDETALQAGLDRVAGVLDGAAKRGIRTADQRSDADQALSGSISYRDLADCDLVIEAVFEDMDVKTAVFSDLDRATRPDAILATNTSYLDVNAIARSVRDPSRVVGLHFFSPAHVMKLLEVVVTDAVADDALATAFAFARTLGKTAVPSGVCDGFIGNRIMSAYRRDGDEMLLEGALPDQIDAAMQEFGFPMGLYAMQDLAGLDIAWAARKRRGEVSPIADALCHLGRFGRKTGRGWYDYSTDPKGTPDPEVARLIEVEADRQAITRSPFSGERIMARIIATMQAEGRRILDEGISDSAAAVDVVMVNGYGFPRWRGGPMYMGGL